MRICNSPHAFDANKLINMASGRAQYLLRPDCMLPHWYYDARRPIRINSCQKKLQKPTGASIWNLSRVAFCTHHIARVLGMIRTLMTHWNWYLDQMNLNMCVFRFDHCDSWTYSIYLNGTVWHTLTHSCADTSIRIDAENAIHVISFKFKCNQLHKIHI